MKPMFWSLLIPAIIFFGISIYGVILAIKLMRKGEWQWFCLPFIGVPLGLMGKAVEATPFNMMQREELRDTLCLEFAILSIAALLSGGAVYWLMRRYRQETNFVHFYAANYFLCAALFVSVCFASTFSADGNMNIFAAFLGILPLYGFIVALCGIAVMRERVKHYKQNSAAMPPPHKTMGAIKKYQEEKFPWQEL